MVRGRLAVVVGLLASGVAWGNPTPGTIWGYVIWPNGQPMQAAQVYALPAAGTPGETDNDGRYEITGVAPGNYEVYINTEYCCHEPQSLHRPATVVAGQATRLDFTPQPLVAMPEMEIDERKGQVVGNLTAIRLRLKWEACTVWPRRLRVAVDQRPAGRHGMVLCDAELDPDWVAAHTVGFAWDERDVLWAFGEVVVPWDTTLCANAEYDIGAKVWFDNSFCGNQPDILVDDSDWATVRNVVIHGGETSADSQDYLVYDPAAPANSELRHPSVTFQIVDEGPAFSYRWTVYVRKTDSSNWCADYVWLTGTAGAGEEVTAVFNVPDDDQTQSADLDEGGSYAFDVQVVERMWREELQDYEDVDEYWLKYPYFLRVPQYAPGTTEPSHEAVFVENEEQPGSWDLWLNYYLHDNCGESAQWVNATILDPELEVVEVISDLPTAPGVMHSGLLLKTFSESELLPGIYRVILTAEDSHGDDHYSPANLDNPKRYREGENKRMLAANDPVPSPVHGDLVWADCPNEDQEAMPGLAIPFNVDAESGEPDGDYLHPGPYGEAPFTDEDELRELRVRTAAPGCTLALSAPANTVKVWRTMNKAPAELVDFSTPVPVSKGDVFWVEGVGFSVEPQDVVFTLVHPPGWPGPLPVAELVTATVVGVTTVAWEAYPGNPPLTPNESVTVRLHEPSLADGVRIFPDHEPGVAATGNEAKVLLRAAVRPLPTEGHPLPSFQVTFVVFDIDDTSAGGPHTGFVPGAVDYPPLPADNNHGERWYQTEEANCLIDTNDTGAQHLGGDNRRPDEDAPFELVAPAPSATGTAGACAVASMLVSLHPGDNYRACASVIAGKCWTSVLDPAGGTGIVHPVLTMSPAPCTVPLTVWRRFWLESDSLAAMPEWDVYSTVAGIHMVYSQTWVDLSPSPSLANQDTGELENGTLAQDDTTWAVYEHVRAAGSDSVFINPGIALPTLAPCMVRDDDKRSLLPWTALWSGRPTDVANHWTLAEHFLPAFIVVEHAEAHTTLDVPWQEYAGVLDCTSSRGLPSSAQDCWTARVLYSHQELPGNDADPGVDGFGLGLTIPTKNNNALVYVPVIHDFLYYDDDQTSSKVLATTLHELGHLAGASYEVYPYFPHHWEAGVMATDGIAKSCDPYTEPVVVHLRSLELGDE